MQWYVALWDIIVKDITLYSLKPKVSNAYAESTSKKKSGAEVLSSKSNDSLGNPLLGDLRLVFVWLCHFMHSKLLMYWSAAVKGDITPEVISKGVEVGASTIVLSDKEERPCNLQGNSSSLVCLKHVFSTKFTHHSFL